MCRTLCKSVTLTVLALIGIAALSSPAMAQVCSGTNVVTALGSLSNKVPGSPPSAQSTALLRYTFGNDVTSDCDLDSGNGGVSQTVTQVTIRPSCNISGGACLPDPGGDDADPTTPAVAFLSLDATTCTGGLGNITVDPSNPFAVTLNFTVPLVFAPNTNCSVDVTLHVRERGNATTQNTVAQQWATDGVCGCKPPLNAGGNASSQILLTCPPCSTNFCAPEVCNPTTVQCDAQTPPDCSNPDNDLCTPGSCDPNANKGNGACVDGERTVCGNESNFCAPGHCEATTGTCVLDKPPVCPNSFCAPGRCDAAANACVLDTPPVCPNSFCAPGHCDVAADACVLDSPPTCPNSFCAPGHCDVAADACVLDSPPTCPSSFCAPGHCDVAADACVLDSPPTCPNSFCAPGHCDVAADACVLDSPPTCPSSFCAPGHCDVAADACILDSPPTCPSSFCAPGHCDVAADACILDTPPTCPSSFCAPGHCDVAADACILDTPPTCPSSFCAPGHCDVAADACILDTPPTCPSSFCAPGHCDAKADSCVLDSPPTCPSSFCKPGHCDAGADACVVDTPPTCPSSFCAPGHCDDTASACVLDSPPTCPNSFCAPGHCDAKADSCVLDTPPTCPSSFCKPGHCDAGANACVVDTPTTCPSSFCAPGHCDDTVSACVLDTPPTCPSSFCKPGHCDAGANACVVDTPTTCPSSFCAPGHCDDTVSACVLDTPPVCTGNFCKPSHCDNGAGACVPDTPPSCDDGNACTDDKCDPSTGRCVNTPRPTDDCDDGNFCTDDKCDPASGCVSTPKPPEFCNDNDQCTDDVCDPEDGCVHGPAEPMPPACAGACRMTGGHNFDVIDAEFDENGKVYTTGGQIGAPNESGCCALPPKGKCVAGRCTGGLNGGNTCRTNGDCPNDTGRNSHCPWGDWEHNHHSGSDDSGSMTGGSFAFHSGTAAAPDEAFIKSVLCADPGWCVQARPAPFKQIFWEGTGVFHNTRNRNRDNPLPIFGACGANQPVPYSRTGGTLHYYKAHVGDFGEPGGIHQNPPDACEFDETCSNPEPNQSVEIGSCALGDVCLIDAVVDPVKTALHPLCTAQTCSECPDLYEIEIHCTADPASPVAYRVSHFIRQGNFQLHPPVGDSCNP